MGWVAPVAAGAATVGSAAISGKGASEAAKTQARSAGEALDFAKQQEANKLAIWKYEWQQRQNALKPYRAARAATLAKYGINVDQTEPTMPDFANAIPPGWKQGDPIPTDRFTTPSDQATLDKAKLLFPNLFQPKPPPGAGPAAATTAPPIDPTMLANWSEWAKYGVPKA